MVRDIIRWLLWKAAGPSRAGRPFYAGLRDSRTYAPFIDHRFYSMFRNNRGYADFIDRRIYIMFRDNREYVKQYGDD